MPPRIPGPRPQGNPSILDLVLPQLQAWVENLPILGDIIEAITGREDGDPNDIGSQINKLKSWIGGLFGFRTSIASRVSAIEGKIATGAEFYDDFNRGENTGGLGNGWVQGGEGQPLGIRDQAAMIIQGGITAQQGLRWAKSKQPASGDTFTVSMVTHPVAPSRYAQTWLMARMNAAFTEGLAVRMVAGKCWISRVSRSSSTSNTWNLVDVATNTAKSYSQSATVEFKGEETVLQVLIDSEIVLTATDTTHTIDAAHRENGFAEQTTTQALGFSPEYSGALASYPLKSVAALQSVVTTAQGVATATVTPVASAVTAGATGAEQPVDADPTVYAATKTVADTATAAQNQAANTAIQVQQQTQNNNVGSGGVNKLLTFSPDGPLNSTDWTAGSAFTVASSQMALTGAASQGFYLARANYVFNTDDQAVTFQLGSEQNNDQYTYGILRADATGKNGVAVRVSANSIAIGTVAFGADGDSTAGFTLSQSVSRGQASGDSIEFRAVGSAFVVLVNGAQVLVSTGSLGSTGSSNRNAAVVMQKAVGFLTFYSFRLRSFGMYDYGTVGSSATNRTNARISRTSNSSVTVSVGNGAYLPMPANYYSTIDSAVGMTVTDIANGKIRVDVADWYEIEVSFSARYQTGNGGTLGGGDAWWGQSHFVLYVNGTQYTQALLCGVPHRFQFAANDVVTIGIANAATGVGAATSDQADYNYSVPRPATINALGGGPGSFFQISKSYT